jgi:hypothetical protein
MWLKLDNVQYINLDMVENICKGEDATYTKAYTLHYAYDKHEDNDLVQRFSTAKERDDFFNKIEVRL